MLRKLGTAVLVLAAILSAAGLVAMQSEEQLNGPTVTLKNHTFAVDVSDTEAEHEQGLSGRKSLGDDQAMLFVFDYADEYCFWMKDMNFPIDMVWLDGSKRVVYIKENAIPESYPDQFCPDKPANYVLEFTAGTSESLRLRKGDQTYLNL